MTERTIVKWRATEEGAEQKLIISERGKDCRHCRGPDLRRDPAFLGWRWKSRHCDGGGSRPGLPFWDDNEFYAMFGILIILHLLGLFYSLWMATKETFCWSLALASARSVFGMVMLLIFFFILVRIDQDASSDIPWCAGCMKPRNHIRYQRVLYQGRKTRWGAPS